MKTFILIVLLLLTTSLISNELSWVNEQVEAIKPPRHGMSTHAVAYIKDPFIFLAKNRGEEKNTQNKKKSQQTSTATASSSQKQKPSKVKSVSKVLTLNLIMNNSVMINGEWYKIGDKINGFTVSELNQKSVLLTKNKKQLLLSTRSDSKNLKFKR